ncbi:hypothetical protein SERLADRAFT_459537 [Serpula lacrymans var. lacrymans S7.9]|uniref:Uncharacterized protein n=1 Tax=Serpula lacrymans var. lacrymans (strain S7.9) TaxID=578457 RepID=F8NKI9_SERL9|nr:uncharacterized protein SERLADRAFT_459537 [Serpula lacrymans var. lacrymans S7.9]EGO28762.1 hypothetical protein SERLADRAFT_459537 [Serpula lacrymans var. lacrymans S7.9]
MTKYVPLSNNVTIQGIDGKYLRVVGDGLEFTDQAYDPNAKFSVEAVTGGNILIGANGKYVRMYDTPNFDIKCDAMNSTDAVILGTLFIGDGLANLTITKQRSLSDETVFLSSLAGTTSYSKSLRSSVFEDITCRFIIANV